MSKTSQTRIAQAISDLNYRPNALARSLVTKRTFSVGVVIDDMTATFIVPLIEGLERGLLEADTPHPYTIIYTNSRGDAERKRLQMDYMTQGRVDGIILYGSMVFDDELIRQLRNMNFPLVLVENDLADVGVHKVVIDNVGGAFAATEHLIKLGHRKIAHIGGNMNLKITMERMNGYVNALQQYGIPVNPDRIIFPDFRDFREWKSERGGHSQMYYTRGYEEMKKLIDKDRIPEALFFATDLSAFGAIRALKEAGLDVPKDVSIIGFDDESAAAPLLDAYPITTMRQPLLQAGGASVKMLIDSLEQPDKPPERKVLDTQMILRDTTMERRR